MAGIHFSCNLGRDKKKLNALNWWPPKKNLPSTAGSFVCQQSTSAQRWSSKSCTMAHHWNFKKLSYCWWFWKSPTNLGSIKTLQNSTIKYLSCPFSNWAAGFLNPWKVDANWSDKKKTHHCHVPFAAAFWSCFCSCWHSNSFSLAASRSLQQQGGRWTWVMSLFWEETIMKKIVIKTGMYLE